MKKLSKLQESIWSDIQDRSSGETVRKEDLLSSIDDLADYICSHIKEGDETLDLKNIHIEFDSLKDLFDIAYTKNEAVKNIKTIDVTGWNVSKVKNMSGVFSYMKFTNIIGLETWDMSNVEDTSDMFMLCTRLQELDLEKWNMSKVTDISDMFYACEKLTNLKIGSWDVSNVETMSNTFYGCKSLTEIHIENWVTSKVTTMYSMFASCENLKSIDLNKWDVSNVVSMKDMFGLCEKITNLYIKDWKPKNVTSMKGMFHRCENLEKVFCRDWTVDKLENTSEMFKDCMRLRFVDLSHWHTEKETIYDQAMFKNTKTYWWSMNHQFYNKFSKLYKPEQDNDNSNKITESVWSDIQDRSTGEMVKKEDYGKDIVIDGEKYYLSKEFWTLGEEYEEENSDEWKFFAFNKPKDGSNKIIGNTDDIGVFGHDGYDTDDTEYDVYVLRDYLGHTKEELIENTMKEGQFNLIVYPEVKNICKDYITKLYESHMSDYADYWVNQVSTSDWGSGSTGLHIEIGTDFIPEYVEDEFKNNEIEMAHIFCFPLLSNWVEGFEQDLIKTYEKLGWVKSEEYDIDPYDNNPGNMTALCFVQLNK